MKKASKKCFWRLFKQAITQNENSLSVGFGFQLTNVCNIKAISRARSPQFCAAQNLRMKSMCVGMASPACTMAFRNCLSMALPSMLR